MSRPPLFDSVETLEDAIEGYFKDCEKDSKPLTMSGLAVALEVDRKTILNYSNKEEFFPTIKKARDKVEAFAEEQLYRSGQVTGVIFNLKNNFDWKDKHETEHSGNLGIGSILDEIDGRSADLPED